MRFKVGYWYKPAMTNGKFLIPNEDIMSDGEWHEAIKSWHRHDKDYVLFRGEKGFNPKRRTGNYLEAWDPYHYNLVHTSRPPNLGVKEV